MGNGGSKKKRSSFRNEQRLSVGTQPAVTNTTSTAPTTNPPKESNTSQKDELSSLFDKYQALDSHEGESEKARDYIGGEGIMKLAEDIGIDPEDVITLIMTYRLEAKEQYKIARNEFMNFKKYSVNNLSQMKQQVPQWKNQILNDKAQFKGLYAYAFEYMRDPGQKGMSVELAIPTWKMLLTGRYKYINEWCDFIENDYKKTIQKDTWNLFYDFIQAVGDNLSLYSEDQAWPIAIDTFVEKLKSKK